MTLAAALTNDCWSPGAEITSALAPDWSNVSDSPVDLSPGYGDTSYVLGFSFLVLLPHCLDLFWEHFSVTD